MNWKPFDFKRQKDVHPKELSKEKTMHSTKKRAMPIKTSDEIRTMSVARSGWSVPKPLSGCSRTKDDTRLKRNESALKRRRLRIENIALRRKIRQMENLLEMEGK